MAEARLIRRGPRNPFGIEDDSYVYSGEGVARPDHAHEYAGEREILPLQNGFTTFAAGFRELSIFPVGKFMMIEGIIKKTVAIGAATVITNIPSLYRPAFTPVSIFAAGQTTPAGFYLDTELSVEINSAGNMVLTPDSSIAPFTIENMIMYGSYLLR